MADEYKQFENILFNLLSTENEPRAKAEQTYEEIPAENKIIFLLNCLTSVARIGEEASQLAAVLLRRVISSDFENFFPKLPEATANEIKKQLLLAIQQDLSPALRKKICDATAELARNLIDDDGNNHWPDFLKFLFDCASSNNHVLKEASLLMFSSVPGVFGNQQNRYLDVIQQMLCQSLQDQSAPQHMKAACGAWLKMCGLLYFHHPAFVCYAAVKATTAFLILHEKESNIHKHFSDCLPHFLQVLSYSLEKQDDEAENILKSLVDIGESCPQFLRSHLDMLLQLCLKVLSDENSNEACSHLCLEVVVTLSETAPAMIRKLGSKHVSMIVPLIFKMMVDLDDDQNWDYQDDADDEDNESNPVVGESSLDRLACALGGKTILPLVMNCLPHMLDNSDWKRRHAALMAVSAVGEGCHKQMEGILPMIVDGVLPFLNDPHPRVRYAACNALGQMATDFAPIFEKKFHDKVVPGLLNLMGDYSSPRVQAHAGAALVNFFEDCPKSALAPYLDSVVQKLETILTEKFKELLEKGTKLVLEQTVVTLASVADTAEEKFINYYDRFMPYLKYIIQNAVKPELRLLRGKTIECVSLIGLAVGKDKFLADASEVMDLLLKSQTEESSVPDDDPQLAYLISAWARICKILGKHFAPYLPYVMGPVLKAAALKPEIAVLDNDDMKVVEDDDDWQFISLGEQQNFGIRTTGLEEKATACQMLVCYARELKEGFSAYVEDAVKLMVPMLRFYFHDGVRTAAAESLPSLLECAKCRGDAYVNDMWRYVFPEILKAIDSEPEKEVLSEQMHAFAQCIEVLGGRSLSDADLLEVIKVLDKNLSEHFERAQERQEKRKDQDYDEVLEEALLDEDDEDVYILSKVADILHALFAVYKQDFYPYFDMIVPRFISLLEPDRPWPDRQWSICVFDDVIEHGGPACAKYQHFFLQPMLNALADKSPEIRQAASYGFGVLGQHGGPGFAKICAETIPALVLMINAPESRSVENATATENAIAAVTKILTYNNSQLAVEEILPVWLSWLPVWEDEDESPHVYNFLCTLLEQNNPILLGKDNCNLPRIVMIIAEAFHKDAIDVTSDVGRRIINLVKLIQVKRNSCFSKLKSKQNGEVFSVCVNQLNPQQQEALHTALTVPQ